MPRFVVSVEAISDVLFYFEAAVGCSNLIAVLGLILLRVACVEGYHEGLVFHRKVSHVV